MAAIMAHLLRIFSTGAYRKPRELDCLIGIVLFTLRMLEGLSGYSLPDDLLSGTGLQITQGVIQSIPIAGTYRACSCGGGAALDHACHQRCSTVHGESQARTARSARGQDGAGGGSSAREPPLSPAASRPGSHAIPRRVISEPGGPAETERAVDQGLVAADGGIGADLEVGPAQLVFRGSGTLRGFDRLPAEVELTNPRHPLAGRLVPVRSVYRRSGGVWLMVMLPDGFPAPVRVGDTDLGGPGVAVAL
jgi:Cytochrome b(N-terminal)/b6/petB